MMVNLNGLILPIGELQLGGFGINNAKPPFFGALYKIQGYIESSGY